MAEAAAPSVEETKDPTNIDFEVDKLDELLSDVGPVRVAGALTSLPRPRTPQLPDGAN